MPECPHCGASVQVHGHLTGTRVLHACGRWFLVVHRDGGTELFGCEAPRVWTQAIEEESEGEQDE